MAWYEVIWNWLNGNKTMIGMGLLWLSTYIPLDMMIWIVPVKALLEWIGGLLTGVGFAHKFAKATTTSEPNT